MKVPKRFLAGVLAMSLLFSNMSTVAYAVDEVPAAPEAAETVFETGPSEEELAARQAAEQAAAEEAARQAAEQAAAEEAARQAAEQAAAEEAARQAAEQAAAEEAARQAAEQAAAEEAARQAAEQAAAEEAARVAAEQAAAEEAARQAAEQAAAEEPAVVEEPAAAQSIAAPQAAMAAPDTGMTPGLLGPAILPVPETETAAEPETEEPEAEEPAEPVLSEQTVAANGVTVDAVLPTGTTVTVQSANAGAAAAAIAELLPEGYEPANVKAWDITLTAGGETVQPVGNATVTLPEAPAQDAAVYYIHNGTADKVADLRAGEDTFTVEHFSTYAVAAQVKSEDETGEEPEDEPEGEPEYDIDTGLLPVPGMDDAGEEENGGDDAVVAAPEIMAVPELEDAGTDEDAETDEDTEAAEVTVTFHVAPLEGAEGDGWTLEKAYEVGTTLTYDSPDLPGKDEFTDFPAELELGSWYLDEGLNDGLIDDPLDLEEDVTLYARAIDPEAEYGTAPAYASQTVEVYLGFDGTYDGNAVQELFGGVDTGTAGGWFYVGNITTEELPAASWGLQGPFTEGNDDNQYFQKILPAIKNKIKEKGWTWIDDPAYQDFYNFKGYELRSSVGKDNTLVWHANILVEFKEPSAKEAFEVRYESNGGTLPTGSDNRPMNATQHYDSYNGVSCTFKLPAAATKNNSIFIGWADDDGNVYPAGMTVTITAKTGTVFTAVWENTASGNDFSFTSSEHKATINNAEGSDATVGSVDIGDTICYSFKIALSYNGKLNKSTTVRNVRVTANSGIDFGSASLTFTCNSGQYPTSAAQAFTGSYVITAADAVRGSVTKRVTVSGTYNGGQVTATVTLPTVRVNSVNVVTDYADMSVPYDSKEHELDGSAYVEGDPDHKKYTVEPNITYTSAGKPKDVGIYTATVNSFTVTENDSGTQISSYKVNGKPLVKQTYTIDIYQALKITLPAQSRTYGQDVPTVEELKEEIQTDPADVEVNFTGVEYISADAQPAANGHLGAGTYDIKLTGITVDGSSGYKVDEEAVVGTLTVAKYDLELKAAKTLAYKGEGQLQPADITAVNVEPVSLPYGDTLSEYARTIVGLEGPGTFTATYDGAGAVIRNGEKVVTGNYNITVKVTVDFKGSETGGKYTPEVKLSQTSFKYDGQKKEPAVTVTCTIEGKEFIILQKTVTPANPGGRENYTVNYTDNLNAGTATVTVTMTDTAIYENPTPVTFTIDQREITLRSSDLPDKEYDGEPYSNNEEAFRALNEAQPTNYGTGADHLVTVSGDGFVGTEGVNVQFVDEEGSGTWLVTDANTGDDHYYNKFTYTMKEGTDRNNYNIKREYGQFKITRRNINTMDIIWPFVQDITYDGLSHKTLVEGLALRSGSALADGDYDVKYSYTPVVASGEAYIDVGRANIAVTGTGNYTGVKYLTYQITPADIKVTAIDQTAVYGDTLPAPKAEYVKPADGDDVNYELSYVQDGSPVETPKDAGDYTIVVTPKADQNPNYNVEPVSGKLTITQRPVDITVNDFALTYGDAVPTTEELKTSEHVTVTAVPEGCDAIDYELGYTQGGSSVVTPKNAGEYEIAVTADPSVNKNYSVSKVEGKLTINQRPVDITVNDFELIYGDAVPTTEELKTSEHVTVTAVPEGCDAIDYELGYTQGGSPVGTPKDAGEYEIAVTAGANPNYTVTTANAVLTITPAAVVVTANSLRKEYGEADPALTATVTGVVPGESVAYSTPTRAAGENVGSYPITVTGAAEQGNYTITFVGGTFTVERASATVTVHSAIKRQGEADPQFAVDVSGVVAGDTLAYNITREPGEEPGDYRVYAQVGSNPNYSVDTVDAVLDILPAAAVIAEAAPIEPAAPAAPAAPAGTAGRAGLLTPAAPGAVIDDDAAPLAAASAEDEGEAVEIGEDETPRAPAPEGEAVTVEEDETPLASAPLDAAADCRELPHLLWALLALLAAAGGTYANKRRQANRFSRG